MLKLEIQVIAAVLSTHACCPGRADIINATPDPGSLIKSVRAAKSGDVIRLQAGEYHEAISIPDGVTLEGDAENTSIIVDGSVAIKLGIEARLSGITFRKGKRADIGVDVWGSGRIERCRFIDLPTAIRLAASPLTDVLACEFVNCAVSIEAGHSCPTVWGNIFVGGSIGLRSDAEPFVRNNVFFQNWRGISRETILPGTSCHAVIRDNLFLQCKSEGLCFVTSAWAEDEPFVTHNVFSQCKIAVTAELRVLERIRECLVDSNRKPHFQDGKQQEFKLVGTQGIEEATLKPSIEGTTLTYGDLDLGTNRAKGGGIRYGPQPEWRIFGVHATAPLPPLRTVNTLPVVINSRAEQKQLAKQRRWKAPGDAVKLNGEPLRESIKFETLDGEEVELTFDLNRLPPLGQDR